MADRVAQRAFLQVCGPQLEPARAEVSFAYQRGRSWVDALARAGQYRAQGLRWVFRTDIADFFDSVEHDLLRAVVRTQVPDPAMVELVDAWVQAPALTPKGLQARPRGLPEGAPLSPALANLYLREFDYQVDGRHGRLVRYADDLALFCRDLDAATAGAEHRRRVGAAAPAAQSGQDLHSDLRCRGSRCWVGSSRANKVGRNRNDEGGPTRW